MLLLVLYHSARCKNFKTLYHGIVLGVLRADFAGAPGDERFITLSKGVWALLALFMASRRGHQGNLYAIDRTPLAVGHQRRLAQPRVLAGRAARGKPSRAWFLGLKLPLVFNPQRPLVALKLTQANLSDTTAVPQLTKDLVGKRFADKGEIGKQLVEQLRRRGLALRTRGRRNMKAWPISLRDQALLNGGNSAATIIAHIQEFSSLRLPKHRSLFNPFTHITAAIVAYQIDPLLPKPVRAFMPLPYP